MKTLRYLVLLLAFFTSLSGCRHDRDTESVGMKSIKLNVKVNLKVGKILYQNADATVSVRGFDSQNNEAWRGEFGYVGPNANLFSLKSGYDHYTLEVNKFGISDKKTITAQEIRDGRADGPDPVI